MSESANWPAPEIANGTGTTYAGFGMRALAHICDGLMVALVVVPLGIVLPLVTGQEQGDATIASLTSIIGLLLQSWWIGTRGGSPLRVKTGAIVVDASTGAYIGFARALLRTVATNLFGILVVVNSLLGVVTIIDFLWMLRDPRNQTIHDKIARTVVQQS
jgi:uncharacterized RDD family membrane protein YckC